MELLTIFRKAKALVVKHKNGTLLVCLVGAVSILLLPSVQLLFAVFNLQLMLLVCLVILFFLIGYFEYIRSGWKATSLVAVAGIFFAVLFFISDASKRDLGIINALTAANTYNCDTISAILEHQNSDKVSYNYYIVEPFIQNLGFIFANYDPDTEYVTRQVIYDMTYSNRLTDVIVRLNAPTNYPMETTQVILGTRNQINSLANQINGIIKCPGTSS